MIAIVRRNSGTEMQHDVTSAYRDPMKHMHVALSGYDGFCTLSRADDSYEISLMPYFEPGGDHAT